MRTLLVVVACCLHLAHAPLAQTRSDREFAGLKGPVKSVRVEEAPVTLRDGKPVEGPRSLRRVTSYDAEGNLVAEESYHGGKLLHVRRAQRDGKGVKTTTVTDGDKLLSKFVCAFDDKDRARECSTYAPDGSLTSKTVRTYNDAGRLVGASTYDANGALMNRAVFTPDAEGKQSVDELYNAEGGLIQKQEIVGGEVVVSLYRPDGNVWYWTAAKPPAYEYDSQGNWTKSTTRRTVRQNGVTEEKVEIEHRVITYHPAPTPPASKP